MHTDCHSVELEPDVVPPLLDITEARSAGRRLKRTTIYLLRGICHVLLLYKPQLNFPDCSDWSPPTQHAHPEPLNRE